MGQLILSFPPPNHPDMVKGTPATRRTRPPTTPTIRSCTGDTGAGVVECRDFWLAAPASLASLPRPGHNASIPPSTEPYFRCGQPAELPAVGEGWIAGKEEERIPLCGDCRELLLKDPKAYWEGMRKKREGEKG